MKCSFATLVLSLFVSALVAAPPPPDPVCGTWTWFNDQTKIFRVNGVLTDGAGKAEGSWQCLSPAIHSVDGGRRYVVRYEGQSYFDTLELVRAGTFLDGTNNFKLHVTARRAQSPAPGGATMSTSTAGTAKASAGNYGGMSLASDWMPARGQAHRELLLSAEFYAKAAVGNSPPGKEAVPGVLFGGVRWLMTEAEAIKCLPKGLAKGPERPIIHLCFPLKSLTAREFTGPIEDRGQMFGHVNLIFDANHRVVGVQLEDLIANNVRWEGGAPTGVREPYYNFINLTRNGSSTNDVQFQIVGAGPGVTLIKTALWNHPPPPNSPRYKENIHWYLAAPLARCILDIVAERRKEGLFP